MNRQDKIAFINRKSIDTSLKIDRPVPLEGDYEPKNLGLMDVLAAMPNGVEAKGAEDGNIILTYEGRSTIWNTVHNDLTLQNEECIDFLHDAMK